MPTQIPISSPSPSILRLSMTNTEKQPIAPSKLSSMDPRLAEAARSGNIDALYELLREDPYLLETIEDVPFVDTPLHKAVIEGQTRFVMEMMNLKPSFAKKLNPDGFSPLYLAVEKSQFQLVVELLKLDPSLAFVKGREGLTPLHLAVRNGESELVVELFLACPECIQDVNVDGQTALHIAVAEGRIEVLEALIGWLRRWLDKKAASTEIDVFNKRDHQGNTALHVAAYENKNQELRLLLSTKKVDPNIKNQNGFTAFDVLQSRGQQMDADAERLLLRYGAKKVKITSMLEVLRSRPTFARNAIIAWYREQAQFTEETRNAFIVLTSLITTSTYQMVLQPPGGTADGKVVMNSSVYSTLWMFNTCCFILAFMFMISIVPANKLRSAFLFPLCPLMVASYTISSIGIAPSGTPFMDSLIAFGILITFCLAVICATIGFKSPRQSIRRE